MIAEINQENIKYTSYEKEGEVDLEFFVVACNKKQAFYWFNNFLVFFIFLFLRTN